MKKRMMMIATLALAIYNIVLAGDKVTINDFKISAGETKEVSVRNELQRQKQDLLNEQAEIDFERNISAQQQAISER